LKKEKFIMKKILVLTVIALFLTISAGMNFIATAGDMTEKGEEMKQEEMKPVSEIIVEETDVEAKEGDEIIKETEIVEEGEIEEKIDTEESEKLIEEPAK
jgi:Na+-translocating ferredoxin:NAD+ oxidoreductase RnfG subunit